MSNFEGKIGDFIIEGLVNGHPLIEITKNYLLLCVSERGIEGEKKDKVEVTRRELLKAIKIILDSPYDLSEEKQKEIREISKNASRLASLINIEVAKN